MLKQIRLAGAASLFAMTLVMWSGWSQSTLLACPDEEYPNAVNYCEGTCSEFFPTNYTACMASCICWWGCMCDSGFNPEMGPECANRCPIY
jgi:hypothetical protein